MAHILNRFQCEAEETDCEAQEAIEEEGCEKKVSRFKTRKELRMLYSARKTFILILFV